MSLAALEQGRIQTGAEHAEAALAILEHAGRGDTVDAAWPHMNFASACSLLGRNDEARAHAT